MVEFIKPGDSKHSECDAGFGGEAFFEIGNEFVKKVKINLKFDENVKKTYNGLEVLIHHPSYRKPVRCGKKVNMGVLKKLSATNNLIGCKLPVVVIVLN